MTGLVESVVVAAKTVTLLLGGAITYLAFTAYRSTGDGALRTLAVGFAVVTCGALLAGTTDVLLSVGLHVSVLVQSAITALGFAVILYSLYRIE